MAGQNLDGNGQIGAGQFLEPAISIWDCSNPSLVVDPLVPQQKFTKLPFYENLCELFTPVRLTMPLSNGHLEVKCQFNLTEAQSNTITLLRDVRPGSITPYENHLLFRIGQAHEDVNVPIVDEFPGCFSLKVSGKAIQLPHAVSTNDPKSMPKRPPKAVEITQNCKLSPLQMNRMTLKFTPESGKGFSWGCGVWLVKKLNSTDLLNRLKQKSPASAAITSAKIIEKFGDRDILVPSMNIALTCPMSRLRMKYPCRSKNCYHLQCFDAEVFLMMNEKKSSWRCPYCHGKAFFDDLVLDDYFSQVLASPELPNDATNVELLPNGTWKVSPVEDLIPVVETDLHPAGSNVIDLSSDDEDAAPNP